MLVTFELNDSVDDVFQDLGTRQRSLFVDMPDQDDRNTTGLGETEKGGSAFPDLGDTPRTAFHIFGRNGLDGIDDD